MDPSKQQKFSQQSSIPLSQDWSQPQHFRHQPREGIPTTSLIWNSTTATQPTFVPINYPLMLPTTYTLFPANQFPSQRFLEKQRETEAQRRDLSNHTAQTWSQKETAKVSSTALKRAKMGEEQELSDEELPKENSHRPLQNLNGEKRLVIDFQNLGSLGKHIQTYGRKGGVIIPDGLSGTHSMYGERWKFEIIHEEGTTFVDKDGFNNLVTCITWKLTNLNSGVNLCQTETKQEASFRMNTGRTISSRLFRQALNNRAKELEEELKSTSELDDLKCKNLKMKIKHLRPKRFSEGTLTFGLQHEAVQLNLLKTHPELALNKELEINRWIEKRKREQENEEEL